MEENWRHDRRSECVRTMRLMSAMGPVMSALPAGKGWW